VSVINQRKFLQHACVLYHNYLGHLSRHYFSQDPVKNYRVFGNQKNFSIIAVVNKKGCITFLHKGSQ